MGVRGPHLSAAARASGNVQISGPHLFTVLSTDRTASRKVREKSNQTMPLRRSNRRFRGWRGSSRARGVSDVVATILLLALTVVLFSAIFAFVTSFPSPPAQNSNQFQASIVQAANGTGTKCGGLTSTSPCTMALSFNILHLAGPAIGGNALIYLKSSVHPLGYEFSSPYTLTSGGITSGLWSLGQTWSLTAFPCSATVLTGCNPILPDNITVYITAGSQLLFSAVIPGVLINSPPTFLSVATVPSTPAIGEGFTVDATISNIASTASVQLNLGYVPGFATGTVESMSYSATTGFWSYTVGAGNTTTSGSYYATISATYNGLTGTSSVPITITTYSTLIQSALALSSYSGPTTCPSTGAPAACQSTSDHYYEATLTSSLVTLGSVYFAVYSTTTGAPYTATTHAAFAVSLTANIAKGLIVWTPPSTSTHIPMLVSFSNWTATYANGGAAISSLTTSMTISIDVGSATPPTTLELVVIGYGPYSGQIVLAL